MRRGQGGMMYPDRLGFGIGPTEDQTEDLKSFERRLTEVIGAMQPSTRRWRILLFVTSLVTVISAWNWLFDPETSKVSLLESLGHHLIFTLSCVALVLLFATGVHKRIIAPSLITERSRRALAEFNMACDSTGKLILKPRPN